MTEDEIQTMRAVHSPRATAALAMALQALMEKTGTTEFVLNVDDREPQPGDPVLTVAINPDTHDITVRLEAAAANDSREVH